MKLWRLLLGFLPMLAFAQTVPNGGIVQGQVWTVPQWNSAWQSKTDYPAPCSAMPSFTGAFSSSGCVATLASGSIPLSALASIGANTVLGSVAGGAPSPLTAAPLAALQNTYSSAAVLRARDYGILPTNTAAQNDTGFATLKTQMQSSSTTVWRVIFEPGAYVYTKNRWLWGVRNVIIDAYGVSFQNTNSSGTAAQETALNVNDMFEDWGDVDWPGNNTYASGYLFNTASSGAASITTTTAADAGNFSPGMRVIIMGYDQQNNVGYPPNLRYFEYKTVLTAVAGTGVVTFTDLLANSYDSRWADNAAYGGTTGLSEGAPRILSLERANYTQAHLVWIKGAKFIPNAALPDDNMQIVADLLILEDVQAVSFIPSEMDTTLFKRVTIRGFTLETDKLLNRFYAEDSIFDPNPDGGGVAVTDSVGINSMSFKRCTFFGSLAMNPRSLFIDDSDVVPPSTSHYPIGDNTIMPIRSVEIQNTRIYNTGSVSYGWSNVASPGSSLTVGSVSGSDILLTYSGTVAGSIEYGMTLTNTVTGNTGIITAIYKAGANLRIAGTWSAPSPGDIFYYYDVMQASDGGGNVIVGTQAPFWRGPPGPQNVSSSFTSLTVNGLTQINASNNAVTHIGDGTTTSAVDIGGGANTLNINSLTNLNVSNNQTTNIGTGTTTSAVNLGGGNNTVSIGGTVYMNDGVNKVTNIGTSTTTSQVNIGNAANIINEGPVQQTGGTTFTAATMTGCSGTSGTPTTLSGGQQGGKFVSASNGTTCSVVITVNGATGSTASHVDSCYGADTTTAVALVQSGVSTTTCTLKGTINAITDVIAFHIDMQ